MYDDWSLWSSSYIGSLHGSGWEFWFIDGNSATPKGWCMKQPLILLDKRPSSSSAGMQVVVGLVGCGLRDWFVSSLWSLSWFLWSKHLLLYCLVGDGHQDPSKDWNHSHQEFRQKDDHCQIVGCTMFFDGDQASGEHPVNSRTSMKELLQQYSRILPTDLQGACRKR